MKDEWDSTTELRTLFLLSLFYLSPPSFSYFFFHLFYWSYNSIALFIKSRRKRKPEPKPTPSPFGLASSTLFLLSRGSVKQLSFSPGLIDWARSLFFLLHLSVSQLGWFFLLQTLTPPELSKIKTPFLINDPLPSTFSFPSASSAACFQDSTNERDWTTDRTLGLSCL